MNHRRIIQRRRANKRRLRFVRERRVVAYCKAKKLFKLPGAEPYYEAYDIHLSKRGIKYRTRSTKAYKDLLLQLAKMCGDMTVDLSAIMKPEEAMA